MSATVLGVRIDTFTKAETLKKVSGFFVAEQHMIFTPNPEMLVKAEGDSYFKEVLNKGDLNLCDGVGLWAAMKVHSLEFLVHSKIERIPGTDFMLDICRLAAENGKSIYLLGSGNERVVQKTAERLREKFPGLKIAGGDKGPEIHENIQYLTPQQDPARDGAISSIQDSKLQINNQDNELTLSKINATKPDILFVAFGMGKQEKWIVENLGKLPSVKIAMGVGGAFDYISGKVKRAPLLMRRLGLEWVYRLSKQPQRAGRIFNATLKFCWLMIRKNIGY